MIVTYPREYLSDLSGRALENGSLFVGEAGKDPEVFPLQAYWDEGLTIPATQPIETSAGYAMNNGARASFYVSAEDYSIRIRDRHGLQVDYLANVSPSRAVQQSINLWEYAKGDGTTGDTVAINSALAAFAASGGGVVNCGGPEFTYLLDGPFVQLGTFNAPEGIVPFNRYKVRLYSNLHLIGQGAKFKLSGGSPYVGGIFGHPFWEGERLDNVKLIGIVMDGNQPNQITPIIPANGQGGGGDRVWQHGNAVTGCYNGFEAAHCVFRDLRGHGLNFVWASSTPDPSKGSQHLEIHHCEFVNIFTQACNAGFYDTKFHHNYIHGDGFWVGGMDIELGDPTFPIRVVRCYNNNYDYTDGLSPPESTPMYANNSAEAMAARKHTRRAITAYSPGSSFMGTANDVVIENENSIQATYPLNRFGSMKVRGITARAFIYEDLTDAYHSSTATIISIQGFGQRLPNCEIRDFEINSVLSGHAISCESIDNLTIDGGTIKGVQYAAIRADACSGSINDVVVEEFGKDDSALPSDQIGTQSSAVVLFGGAPKSMQVRRIRAADKRDGSNRRAKYIVYANVAAQPLVSIKDCEGDNLITGLVRDVNTSTYQVDVVDSVAPIYTVNMPVKLANGIESVGGITFRDTAGNITGGFSEIGGNTVLGFNDPGGLEYQMQFIRADGNIQFQAFENGVAVGVPLILHNDGKGELFGTVVAPPP